MIIVLINFQFSNLFNPLTPEAFCKKRVFGHFGIFSGWIWAKLALIWSKMHLQHDSLPFLPLASCFMTFWLRHALKSNRVFGGESDLRPWAFRFLKFFLAFPFSPFLFFLLQ